MTTSVAFVQAIALTTKPELITLVPEKREELTTEGGFAIVRHFDTLKAYLQPFRSAGIEVSLFIEPDKQAIELAAQAGADIVELHTGLYALKVGEAQEEELTRIGNAAAFARSIGLKVVAGHGLNYSNIAPFRNIEEIEEVSIGHAIITRAIFRGLEGAVREMVALIR